MKDDSKSQIPVDSEMPQTSACEVLTASIDIEDLRKKLAQEGNLSELQDLYNGKHIELPVFNSPEKWNFYAGRSFDISDSITLERTRKTLSCIDQGASVLDYGCGYCYLLKESVLQGKKIDYIGIDFSPAFVAKCQRLFTSARFYLDEPDIMKTHRCDYALGLEVMEHIPPSQTLPFLSNMKSGLKVGGKLIVSVPLFENIELLTSPCASCGQLGNPNGHVRSYTPELVCAELNLAGYRVLKTISIFTPVDHIRRLWNVLRGRKRVAMNIIVVAELM